MLVTTMNTAFSRHRAKAFAGLPVALAVAFACISSADAQQPIGVLIDTPSTGNDCLIGTCTTHAALPEGGFAAAPFVTTRTFANGDSYQISGSVGLASNAAGNNLPGKSFLTITFISGNGPGGTSTGNPDNFQFEYFSYWGYQGGFVNAGAALKGTFSPGIAAQSAVSEVVTYCGTQQSPTLGPAADPPSAFSLTNSTGVSACTGNTFFTDTTFSVSVAAGTQPGAFIVAYGNGFRLLADTHDGNSDTFSDVIWRDGSGNLAFWMMNSGAVLQAGTVGGTPATWSIVGQRDFNGDLKSDLLWRDTSGNTAIWFMNGTQIASAVSVGNVPNTWSVAATGDFDGDGFGDILWRDGSGNLAVWLMNGATIASSGGLGNVPSTVVVVGTGDFNGDGKTDLLWRDNAGNTSIWFMNGTSVSSAASVGNVPTNWFVAGTGDFNNDGDSDIVWRDNAGNISVWLMSGASVTAAGSLGNVPPNWSIVLTGDYNADSFSDLLWRDDAGNTSIWFMNGLTVASTAGVGNIPTNWTIQSANSE